jgi:hypothetical protein
MPRRWRIAPTLREFGLSPKHAAAPQNREFCAFRSGRRNFTLGHEIGHFLIPNHRFQRTKFECATADMRRERAGRSWDTSPILERVEVEANEFSATLLVPGPEYRDERKKLSATSDVAHIRHLAEAFDVWQEMMARRYVSMSDDNIAVIISHLGQVKRVIPKTSFPYLGLRKDVPIPVGALTHMSKSSASDSVSELCEVPTHVWLERRGNVTSLYEQVFVQEEGWVMTLLVVDEDEIDDGEDDRNWNRRSNRR